MKLFSRILCLGLAVLLLPVSVPAARAEAETPVTVTVYDAKGKETDPTPVTDGDPATGITYNKNKNAVVNLEVPEGTEVRRLYLRVDQRPASAELLRQEGRKWVTVTKLSNPGPEILITTDEALTGKIRVQLTFSASVACTVTGVYAFASADGELPEYVHAWQSAQDVDVLLAADTLADIDTTLITQSLDAGRTVAVCAMTAGGTDADLCDALWDAGVRILPGLYSGKKNAEFALTGWIRAYKPLVAVGLGSMGEFIGAAAENGVVTDYDIDSASEWGLWTPNVALNGTETLSAALADPGERSNDGIRALCAREFEDAAHADPSVIPYPDDRLEDGYLPEGADEFLYEDEDAGVWAYLSSTVQVQILRYTTDKDLWYMADVQFKPEYESFCQHTWVNADFKDQQIYPETLAQDGNLVIAVNGDYYPYRVNKKSNVGNIIRNRTVLYEYDSKKKCVYPCLDTLALRDDGTISVYAAGEITAKDLLDQGDVHDALSFGPYLARDGQLRVYTGNSYDDDEPRSAIGMISAGHYILVMVEGKMPKKAGGQQGMDLNRLARLLYAQGVTDAFNIDGGSTAVMVFMGKTLNRTGKASSVGKPRNQHELFGVGTSSLTHTDMINAR